MGNSIPSQLNRIDLALQQCYAASLEDAGIIFGLYRPAPLTFAVSLRGDGHCPPAAEQARHFFLRPGAGDLLIPYDNQNIAVTTASVEDAWAGLQELILGAERTANVSVRGIHPTFGMIRQRSGGFLSLILPPEFTAYHTGDRDDDSVKGLRNGGLSRYLLGPGNPPCRIPFLQHAK